MKRVLVLALSAIAVSGCAPYLWDKQGVAPQDRQLDMVSCDRQAREVSNYGPGFGHAHLRIESFKKCMNTLGYTERI